MYQVSKRHRFEYQNIVKSVYRVRSTIFESIPPLVHETYIDTKQNQ